MTAFMFPEEAGPSGSATAAGPLPGLALQNGAPDPTAPRPHSAALAQRQRRWFETALAAVSNGYYVFDLDARFCYVDAAFAEMLRRPAAGILGKNFSELGYPPELAATLQRQIAEAIHSRRQLRQEAPFTLAGGASGCHEYIFAPVIAPDGTVEAVSGLMRDVTECKNTGRALQLAHADLENQVRQRTVELVESNQLLQAEIGERRLATKRLLETQQLLRQLAAHQERVKEEECKRIAREIHDELGQNLLALRIDVSRLQVRAGLAHPALNLRAGAALEQIDHTIKSVRSIINNLRPAVLDLGLYAAIEWQVREFRRRSGIACELIGDEQGFACALDEDRATAFFRILQEALSNVTRHAGARQVRIELRADAASLFMRISDDGVGMEREQERKNGSFGLAGMRERIGYLQGQLTVDGVPGQGTALTVSVPLTPLPPATTA